MEEDHEIEEEQFDVPEDFPGFEWDAAQESEDPNAAEKVEQLPAFTEDEYLLVLPGGEIEIAQILPKPRKLPKALVLHNGCLIVCERRRRSTIRTPSSTVDDPELPLASRLVMVFIEQRSATPRNRSRRYLIVTDENEDLLAWIDHSPPGWDFQGSQVRALAQRSGLECSTEGFAVETEFELAHPGWMG
ncbi:MAG TPA: hypothetical protein VII76_09035 [Acidimicrobiales bacterium]